MDIRERSNPENNYVYGVKYKDPVFAPSKYRNDREMDPKARYMSGEIPERMKEAKEKADGGTARPLRARVWRLWLEAGLVDENLIHIIPGLLGDGTHFYSTPGLPLVELELIESLRKGKLSRLRLAVRRTNSNQEDRVKLKRTNAGKRFQAFDQDKTND